MAEKNVIDDRITATIREIYRLHSLQLKDKSCDLERSLSIREPFYCLRRVPRFLVRPDLHSSSEPAYTPLVRLDDASTDDLTWKVPVSCRKLLVEGDDGSGKTMICFRLIHGWYDLWRKHPNMPEHCLYISGTQNFDTVDAESEITSCKEFISLITQSVLTQINSILPAINISKTEIQSWILANAHKMALIVDNMCITSQLFEYICDLIGDNQLTFSRLLIFTKPGLLHKTNVDCLFYSYGLSIGYSHRVFTKHLEKQYGEIDHIITPILRFDPSMELFRNPLSCSLLGSYLELYLWDNGMDIPAPSCKLDLLDSLIHVSTSNLITVCRASTKTCTTQDIKHFIEILEKLAFKGIQTGSYYISKNVLPEIFHDQHICDLHFLYEVHNLDDVVPHAISFTGRCFRDYFASRHVCKQMSASLQSDDNFHQEILSSRYSSLWSLCARSFYRDSNYSLLCWIIESLLNKVQSHQYIKQSNTDGGESTRAGLKYVSKILHCLKECEFEAMLTYKVCAGFPEILEISFNQCPLDTIQNFISLCSVTSPRCQEVSVYWDKLNIERSVTEALSSAINSLQTVNGLVVRATSIDNTDQFARFICGIFDNNSSIECLTIGGPLNAVHNISQHGRNNISKVFVNPKLVLRKLALENFNYHYRSMYVLNCWPAIFHTIRVKKCSLDSAGKAIARLTENFEEFHELCIEFCACPPKTLLQIFSGVDNCRHLTVFKLSYLCTNRIVSKVYVKHPNFKTSFNESVSLGLSNLLGRLPNLAELQLCYNGIDDASAKVIIEGVFNTRRLTYIDITGNNLTDVSVDVMVSIIHTLPNLQTLLLCDNSFTTSGRKHIIKGSIENNQLRLGL
ncbi:uncharacterized protein LOC126831153 [Patella vulgata]|uniref:uncharacterized protein LOC126831153 n=1 Tax=Patella vulgata TaxID=6465 RepID=UPI00217FF5CE|nr:uncharacterized protein LOC126831153 [Patella vulgata]